ncbi:ribonucleotide reductase-like protein [Saguinine gammaherpesvirus 1]|uniref:ribonucleoside-diphosphate reductase n=1 Tax=Saguinine gammaherpesvirus 1 TaxID=2169901 RepID=A0A9Q8QWA9_9GAMA|nr:ribonucleotide reductase-like protein [Saguinine gammaherpesvirus 1]
MESVAKFLYTRDHDGFAKLTQETWQNRWFPSQIPLTLDSTQLDQLSNTDKEFYRFLFTFLGMAESLVNFNIEELIKYFSCHDVTHYYTEQSAMECIHGKVYANILNMFFNSVTDMYTYGEQIISDPTLCRKVDWLRNRIKNAKSRAESVLIFLMIEGIFFVSSFYSISLLRVRGILNGVCLANDYISRDELLHTRAAALLYNTMVATSEKPDVQWINTLFKEAVEIEYDFVASKGENVTALNLSDIKSFLNATCDRILKSIDLQPVYHTPPPSSCPLVYTGCFKNVNFFERENTEYTSSVVNDL